MIQLVDQNEVIGTSTYKEIMKSYKFEMKPTKKQEVILSRTIEACRHLYNLGLEQRKKAYDNGGWSISCYEQINQLPELRQKYAEFNNVYAQLEQDVLRRLDKSVKNFFRRVKNNKDNNNSDTPNGEYKQPGFPRFKGYGRYDSFTFPQYGYGCNILSENNDIIKLPKIGEIKFIKHRNIEGIIKTVTIKREINKWFAIFTSQLYVEIPIPKQFINVEELNNKSIGIDMGLNNLATLSNGKKIELPKYLIKSEKKLAKHQRILSRKQIYEKDIEIIDRNTKKNIIKKVKVNSKNREKERIKVAKIHRRIVNQRRNFNHEVSRTLIDNFDLIAFEKLNIQNMVQNHHFAKSISDAGWYQLQFFTSYKAEWAGKIIDFVDPKYTSQICSRCGKLVGRVKEGDIFECPFCVFSINVHINAANNIRDRSIEYQNRLRLISTVATTGRACLSSLNRDTMIQETLPNKKDGNIADTKLQSPPLREG